MLWADNSGRGAGNSDLALQIDEELLKHKQLPNDTVKRMSIGLQRVKTVIDQIHIITSKDTECKVFVSRDYKLLQISEFTEFENDHYLELRVDDNMEVTVASHSLPDVIDGSPILKTSGTIEGHFEAFLILLRKLQLFYDNMNTIDAICFVVGPAKVTTKSVTRTLKIADNIYVKIVVNPSWPSSISTNIIGPTYVIESFRSKYEARCRDWDINLNIHRNLLRMFEQVYFPMRTSDQDESNEKTCGICLAYRSGLQIPIVSCDNVKCELVYHTDCLTQWFATLLDSKTYLTRTMGICPYCKEKLSTSFVDLLENDDC